MFRSMHTRADQLFLPFASWRGSNTFPFPLTPSRKGARGHGALMRCALTITFPDRPTQLLTDVQRTGSRATQLSVSIFHCPVYLMRWAFPTEKCGLPVFQGIPGAILELRPGLLSLCLGITEPSAHCPDPPDQSARCEPMTCQPSSPGGHTCQHPQTRTADTRSTGQMC